MVGCGLPIKDSFQMYPVGENVEYEYHVYKNDEMWRKEFTEVLFHQGNEYFQKVDWNSEDDSYLDEYIIHQNKNGVYSAYVERYDDEVGANAIPYDEETFFEMEPYMMLKLPAKKGASWTTGGAEFKMTHKITDTNATVKTPFKTFKNATEVSYTFGEKGKGVRYYAENYEVVYLEERNNEGDNYRFELVDVRDPDSTIE